MDEPTTQQFVRRAFVKKILRRIIALTTIAGLIYGLLALTHHTSFFTFTPFLIIYILYLIAAKVYKNHQSPLTNRHTLLFRTLYAAAAGFLSPSPRVRLR